MEDLSGSSRRLPPGHRPSEQLAFLTLQLGFFHMAVLGAPLRPPLCAADPLLRLGFLSPQSFWGFKHLDGLGEVALEAGTGEGLPWDADSLPSSVGFFTTREWFRAVCDLFLASLARPSPWWDFCPPSSSSCLATNDACIIIQLLPFGAITRGRTPSLSVGMPPSNETWLDGWTFGPWGQTFCCS